LAEELRRQGHEVVAIVADPVAAETARRHCDRLYQGDLMQLELKERKYFDRIVLGDVLEHLPNPLQALERLNPALREDGKFIISVPNVAHVTVRLKLLMGHFEYTDRGILDRTHQRFFTRKSFHALLQAAGLRVESIWATPAPVQLDIPWTQARMFAPLHELHRLACSLFQGLLGYQFIAVASVDR
jgi:2-polyprenyl-3-methyl-5-hydroxy-6-metoxy-1,4-benzoquinol methylase